MVGGQVLKDVIALASGGSHALALKKDGHVTAWGDDTYGAATVPVGLDNVIAVAAAEHQSMALKRDGTVVAWGGNYFGQTSVPTGLSNVVAIAAGSQFNLAVTTGSIPSSVFIIPHGDLEIMERDADLVFKGRVISSSPITNAGFPDWGDSHDTKLEVVSVLKGNVTSKTVDFLHITHGPMAWSGGSPPPDFILTTGESYIIFATKADKQDWLYSPPSNHTSKGDEFRQLMKGEAPIRTLDSRPLNGLSVKEAHWHELNLLLNDSNPTNQLYAIEKLDSMSFAGRRDDAWQRSDDFRRKNVLSALLSLVTNSNEQVATRAIGCFAVESNAAVLLEPFSGMLMTVANEGSSSHRRLDAIVALSGTHFESISNSLAQLLKDPDDNVRSGAVNLLTLYPGNFAERALRERASDSSPNVRASVADVIGTGKITMLLPTLQALFLTSPVQTNSGPLPHKLLSGDGYFTEVNANDIHACAGYALLKFDIDQTSAFLKTNLSDSRFGLSFIRKLSQNGAEPYLPLLAKELKAHTAGSEQEAAKNGFHWSLSYWLLGNYGWAWDTLFSYVSAQPRETLNNPQTAQILDALQIADDPGDARTRALYGFFLDKGMLDRAIELRRGIIRRTEDKAIDKNSFNFPTLLKIFDEIDQAHSLKPGLGLYQ